MFLFCYNFHRAILKSAQETGIFKHSLSHKSFIMWEARLRRFLCIVRQRAACALCRARTFRQDNDRILFTIARYYDFFRHPLCPRPLSHRLHLPCLFFLLIPRNRQRNILLLRFLYELFNLYCGNVFFLGYIAFFGKRGIMK